MRTFEQKRQAAEAQARYRARHPERVAALKAKQRANPVLKARWAKRKREAYLKKSADQRRHKYLIYTHGLSVTEYAALLTAQGGRCANPGCGVEESQGRTTHLHVDHDHATGKVRGLLCNRCNVALGMMRDSAEKLTGLALYIRHHVAETARAEMVQ